MFNVLMKLRLMSQAVTVFASSAAYNSPAKQAKDETLLQLWQMETWAAESLKCERGGCSRYRIFRMLLSICSSLSPGAEFKFEARTWATLARPLIAAYQFNSYRNAASRISTSPFINRRRLKRRGSSKMLGFYIYCKWSENEKHIFAEREEAKSLHPFWNARG